MYYSPYSSIADVIERRSVQSGDCVIWQGSVSSSGYGEFKFRGAKFQAHRASWLAFRGVIPAGLFVCHTCDRRLCVNPDHLFISNHLGNMRDMDQKGRRALPKGTDNPHAKLTGDIREIRSSPLRNCELARRFRVDRSVISRIRTRKAWVHIDPEFPSDKEAQKWVSTSTTYSPANT